MTKEQKEKALAFLKDMQECTYDGLEEIRTAIEALEQRPCEDCVSRAEMLKYQQYLRGKMPNEENHKLWEFIKALPPVIPTQSWTPIEVREPTQEEKEEYLKANGEELCYMVDSRMPEDGQEVLVSHGGYVTTDVFLEEFWNFEDLDIENVEAWMPLPQLYEEKGGNKA